jgi:hypothetical protein
VQIGAGLGPSTGIWYLSAMPKARAPFQQSTQTALHVAPLARGWTLRRPFGSGVPQVFRTQREAIQAAQTIASKQGGAVRIEGRTGAVRTTYTLGRAAIAKINAVEGAKLSPAMKREFERFDLEALAPKARRDRIARKLAKA